MTDASNPAGDILIVEDSKTQAQLLQHLLASRGHQVRIAGDGREGLEAARQRRPSVVITDVEMPIMNGYDLCRAIKDDASLSSIPVILLTSLSDANDVLRGLAAGTDYYLTKPYDQEYLTSLVEQVLAGTTAVREESTGEQPVAPLEVFFDQHRYEVTAGRKQIVTLLLSTYGGAVQRNRELEQAERKLQEQNRHLEQSARAEREALEALKKAQTHLVQSEKLAALGQMVAGVAHEINNPLAFVGNNITVLQRDVTAVANLLKLYTEVAEKMPPAAVEAAGDEYRTRAAEIAELSTQIDLAYTLPNLQDILVRSKDGVRRIQQIVRDLRDFARLDESDLSEIDLNIAIESVLNIIGNKPREKSVNLEHVAGQLPLLTCYAAKINQVVMNLVSNAIDATDAGGKVVVQTEAQGKEILIHVIDTGKGIDPAIRDRIFDPFFTTKAIGLGTGLGLSISYGIVRDHNGVIEVKSALGAGSTFTVRLPIREATT